MTSFVEDAPKTAFRLISPSSNKLPVYRVRHTRLQPHPHMYDPQTKTPCIDRMIRSPNQRTSAAYHELVYTEHFAQIVGVVCRLPIGSQLYTFRTSIGPDPPTQSLAQLRPSQPNGAPSSPNATTTTTAATMGLSCGVSTLKYILFILNILCLVSVGRRFSSCRRLGLTNTLRILQIISMATIGIGIYAIVATRGVESLSPLIKNTSYVLLAVGILSLLISGLGCCGAIRHSVCMLNSVRLHGDRLSPFVRYRYRFRSRSRARSVHRHAVGAAAVQDRRRRGPVHQDGRNRDGD